MVQNLKNKDYKLINYQFKNKMLIFYFVAVFCHKSNTNDLVKLLGIISIDFEILSYIKFIN